MTQKYLIFDSISSWKDPNCIFRKDNKTQLKVLPTLAKWGTQKRLQGSECQSEELLNMLFTEKDD